MRRFGAVLGAALLLFALAVCETGPARADPRVFSILDFQFEDGSVLPDLHIAYETRGTLAPGHDNAILLLPGAIGDRHAFDALVGPGKTFDTDKYFVITVDPIGSGDSSSPAEGMGQDFPRYTIRDMMEAEHALVSRGLASAGSTRSAGCRWARLSRSNGAFTIPRWSAAWCCWRRPRNPTPASG